MKSHLYTFLLLNVLIGNFALSQLIEQVDSKRTIENPQVKKDTLLPASTLAAKDSLKAIKDTTGAIRVDTLGIDSLHIRFIPGMGQFIRDIDTSDALHQDQFVWSDAKTFCDLFWNIPGFYYRDLGEAGKWGQLNAYGMDARALGIFLDGRPINDPVTGTYNYYDLPLEFIDHTELLSGSQAISVPGAAVTALNFVSRSYNSYRPVTKLRYMESRKGTLLTDGLFSQNVARGLNLMVGFTRQVTDGRFTNALLDAWNVRTRLRYNVSDRFNISLTDFYTKSVNGLNGGVDIALASSIFDEAAFVNTESAWDKRSRRDVTLSTIAHILPDSSSLTQASLYYSTLEREYNNLDIVDLTKASFWGLRVQQQLSFNPVQATITANWERRKADSTVTLPSRAENEWSVVGQAGLHLVDELVPSFTIGSTSFNDRHSMNVGARINSTLAEWFSVFADVSWFDRFPTLQEQYGRNLKDSSLLPHGELNNEQHKFLQAGFQIEAGSFLTVNVTGFQRIVHHAITYRQENIPWNGTTALSISNLTGDLTVTGLTGRLKVRWNHFEAFGTMTLTRTKQEDTLQTFMPDVLLAGELSYRNTFLQGKLDAKVGVRSQFSNRQHGIEFDQRTLSYVQGTTINIGRSTTLDAFIVVKIGDAHISLSWLNLLSAGYLTTPTYPMPGRQIRLGVNWVFLD